MVSNSRLLRGLRALRGERSTEDTESALHRALPGRLGRVVLYGLDLGVLAFRSVLTSGSLLLALSMGLPVIVPHVPSILEYVDGRSAHVMRPGEDLAASIATARARHERGDFAPGSDIVAWARSFEWDAAVAPLVALLARPPA